MKSRSKTPSSHPPRATQTRKAGAVTGSAHGTMSGGHKRSVTSHYRALSAGGGGDMGVEGQMVERGRGGLAASLSPRPLTRQGNVQAGRRVGDVGYGEREREPLIGQWLRWQQTLCLDQSEHHQHAAHTDAQAQMHSRPATSLGIPPAISFYIYVCSCICL